MSTSSWKFLVATAVTSSALIGTAVHPAAAAEEPLFPAGIACTFALDIDGVDNRKVHDFVDVDGNAVQLITGLAGPTTFTNADSGATLTLPARGTAWKVVTSPDGSTTSFTTTGHFVLVLFPSDVPAGPSTTLYVGRVQFTINNLTGVFTLEDTRGTATDLCAALSS